MGAVCRLDLPKPASFVCPAFGLPGRSRRGSGRRTAKGRPPRRQQSNNDDGRRRRRSRIMEPASIAAAAAAFGPRSVCRRRRMESGALVAQVRTTSSTLLAGCGDDVEGEEFCSTTIGQARFEKPPPPPGGFRSVAVCIGAGCSLVVERLPIPTGRQRTLAKGWQVQFFLTEKNRPT